jgi:hypothetical protein
MLSSFRRFLQFITIMLIGVFVFLTFTQESDARRRRSYNPERTKSMAIEIIRSVSPRLCEIAGIEPLPQDSVRAEILDDLKMQSESLSEGDISDEDEQNLLSEYNSEEYSLIDFKQDWVSFLDDGTAEDYTPSGISKQVLLDEIFDWLGTPYHFGGTTRRRIDCSAFTQKIYLAAAEIQIPRVAREQVKVGKEISREELEFGDMIFFHTYSRRFASHVGIYLGDNLFAHASSRYGVTVSSLESSYYKQRFIGGRRLTAKDLVELSIYKETEYKATRIPGEAK